MFKQSIARIFCILTVFLLSSNVVLSSIPFQKALGKPSISKSQSFSPSVDLEQDATYILEKEDPLEDLDFVVTIPFYQYFEFSGSFHSKNVKHFYKVSGPHHKIAPIWLLVQQIII
jgi:hypothetical protein